MYCKLLQMMHGRRISAQILPKSLLNAVRWMRIKRVSMGTRITTKKIFFLLSQWMIRKKEWQNLNGANFLLFNVCYYHCYCLYTTCCPIACISVLYVDVEMCICLSTMAATSVIMWWNCSPIRITFYSKTRLHAIRMFLTWQCIINTILWCMNSWTDSETAIKIATE